MTIIEYLTWSVVLGTGATLVMDLWEWAEQRLLGWPRRDYALLGRWLGWAGRGVYRHDTIAAAAPIRHEAVLGQGVHFAIGVLFAAIFLGFAGPGWLAQPGLAPAVLFGAGTVVFPFLLMQPLFGFGVAAARIPQPGRARLRSLIGHFSFGAGLYMSGVIRLVSGI